MGEVCKWYDVCLMKRFCEDGVPTEEKLRELNLDFTVDDLPY